MKKKSTFTQKRKRREAEEIEEADAFPQLNNVDEGNNFNSHLLIISGLHFFVPYI